MDVIRKPLWRRALRVALQIVAGVIVIGCFSVISLHFAGSEAELRAELHQAKMPLLFWRLALYGVIVFLWLHRVRGYFLRHCTRRFQVYRLEAMMVCLAVMTETTCSRWGM